ncbi:MAG: methionine adenosyltransferase [Planctomycetota bacterium]
MPSQESVLFTSESVSRGHPDKVADQISDAILDAMLDEDPNARVAVETLVTTGLAMVSGEVTTTSYVEIPEVVRQMIKEIGYDDARMGFDYETCAVLSSIGQQSPDIAMGVNPGGAGDQGMMFGYACRETPELMPLPIALSHRLMKLQADAVANRAIPNIRPDAKGQVTIEYDWAKRQPRRCTAVVLSMQHGPEWNDRQDEFKAEAIRTLIKPALGEEWWNDDITVHFNPTGRFEVGGPQGDAGLTGRKIIVDTYGGRGRHGGGAFSGKDPTKVDRSAAYMARHVAKNIVASGAADECEVQLSYAIGVPEPISVYVETFGTAKADENKIATMVRELFPLKPREIIEYLGLRRPIYRETAAHGHFGRQATEKGHFSWERTNMAEKLKSSLGV